jgi:hypothetical protein
VIGLYLAEGGGGGSAQVQFTFSAKEGYLADFVESILGPALNSSFHRRAHGGALRLVVNSIEAKRLFDLGAVCHEKALPWEWMGWPLELRLAIVRGWLVGDGCLRENNRSTKWPVMMISGLTVSRDLAGQALHTLADAGFRPTLKRAPPKTSVIDGRTLQSREAFEIALNGDDTERLLSIARLPPEATRWAHFAGRRNRNRESNSHRHVGPDGTWVKLKSVEEVCQYDGLVYNLVVSEDHSYVVEDTAVHNSQEFLLQWTKQTAAIPIVPFTTGRNKAHPEFGVESLAVEMSNGQWIIPNDNGVCNPEVQHWIDEMLFYQPSIHTGDRLMASYFAREGIRLGAPPPRAERGRINTLAR